MAVLDNGVWHVNKEANELAVEDNFTTEVVSEKNRYHLYMSLACPFAHRPLLVIKYLGLDNAISVSSVAPKRYDNGWLFNDEFPDSVCKKSNLIDLYLAANSKYSGRVSVPVLWDKNRNTIVENDSSSIAEDLATNWLPLAKNPVNLMPIELAHEIREMNTWLHQNINRKVYHVGFATNQTDYDKASADFFSSLDILDKKLEKSLYLFGDMITLSDFFLLPTLVRMEAVYEVHFKANLKPLKAFKNLYRYILNLVGIESIRETIDIDYMKTHYYFSHKHINPTGIIPSGPEINW